MLTERKMFSSSFDSSATSGVETGTSVVADAAVDGGRALGAARREAADDLRRGADRVVGAARIDALGREREREVLARPQAGLLEQRHEVLARGAREGRRLEHDHLVAPDDVRQRPRGGQQRPEVGLAVAGERRGDADEDRLRLVQLDRAGGEVARAEHRLQALVRRCPRSASGPLDSAATRAWSTSTPMTCSPASAKETASGRPT